MQFKLYVLIYANITTSLHLYNESNTFCAYITEILIGKCLMALLKRVLASCLVKGAVR